jgi:hypothetical protein
MNWWRVNSNTPRLNAEFNDVIIDGTLDVTTITVDNFYIATGINPVTGASVNIGSTGNAFNNLYVDNIYCFTGMNSYQITNSNLIQTNTLGVNGTASLNGAVVVGGNATFNSTGGLNFSAVGQSKLTNYISKTGLVATFGTGIVSPATGLYSYQIVGNSAQLTLPFFSATATGNTVIQGNPLDSPLLPASAVIAPIVVQTNTSSYAIGSIAISAITGAFTIYPGAYTTSTFTQGQPIGLPFATTINYNLRQS